MPAGPVNRRDALRLLGLGAAALAVSPRGLATPAAATPLTRPIPSTGELLPVVGLGTWQTFDVPPAGRAALSPVLSAFAELGGRVVDSSPMYGRSQETLGALVTELGLREKLFIATKVWTGGHDDGIRQMNTSMRELRVERIDLMQVHNLVDADTHLATLRDWKRAGRIRHLGVTHYHSGGYAAVERLVEAGDLDFIQINYSASERDAERRLLPLARERGVAVIANRPFGGGGLIRRLSAQPVPDWAAEIEATTWAQLLLKFIIAHPAITCAIPATTRVNHLRDNMRAAHGPLPDERLRERIAATIA